MRFFEENLLSAHIITRISNGTLQPSAVSAAAPQCPTTGMLLYCSCPVYSTNSKGGGTAPMCSTSCATGGGGVGRRTVTTALGHQIAPPQLQLLLQIPRNPAQSQQVQGGLQTKSVHLLCTWQSAKCLARKGKLEMKLPAKRERRQATWRPQSTATHGEPVYRQGSNPGSKVRKGFQNRGCLSHWEERGQGLREGKVFKEREQQGQALRLTGTLVEYRKVRQE